MAKDLRYVELCAAEMSVGSREAARVLDEHEHSVRIRGGLYSRELVLQPPNSEHFGARLRRAV